MKMAEEPFETETLKHIRNRLDYIYSIARTYNSDNPELMDAIASLAAVANMYTKSKLEELKGERTTTSPQGFILSELGNSYSRMKEYEKRKDMDFPSWKL
jgi:DNA repair ATPase RecN